MALHHTTMQATVYYNGHEAYRLTEIPQMSATTMSAALRSHDALVETLEVIAAGMYSREGAIEAARVILAKAQA